MRRPQTVGTPRSPSVLQVLQLRAPSSDVSGCNTMSYEFISLVRNEEVVGSNPISSTRLTYTLFGKQVILVWQEHRLTFAPAFEIDLRAVFGIDGRHRICS